MNSSSNFTRPQSCARASSVIAVLCSDNDSTCTRTGKKRPRSRDTGQFVLSAHHIHTAVQQDNSHVESICRSDEVRAEVFPNL